MNARPRRNRSSEVIRSMIRETSLSTDHLIYPLFLVDGSDKKNEIKSMPGIFQWSLDRMVDEIGSCLELNLNNFVLFPAVDDSLKNKVASYSYAEDNFYLKAIQAIKAQFPDCSLMSDVAMDPYSSDGHDGYVENGKILNDETLPILAKMSVAQAQAGIDIIGPSDMMDGRIGYIRKEMDLNGFTETAIMAYTAKYASAFYGPFRDALDSAPKAGDKKTYQMDPANKLEAIREAELDLEEGADYLMVKPALSYLDVIQTLKDNFPIPVTAYNVSGEYAMLKAASINGWLDYDKVMPEVLLSMRRAGADAILTYSAKDYAELGVRS
ncbi:MAG: porphobilinogen synthase [Bacteroidetes bacterium]|nr:porphobilinogen synthase [Bacteroidota bacterium]